MPQRPIEIEKDEQNDDINLKIKNKRTVEDNMIKIAMPTIEDVVSSDVFNQWFLSIELKSHQQRS